MSTLLNLNDSNKEYYNTVMGNPVIVDNAIENEIRDMTVIMEPTQSGSGDPYPPGGGKNLLEITAQSASVNGVTYTVNRDAAGNVLSVTANGTASELSVFDLTGVVNQPAPQDYIFSGCASRFVNNANVTLLIRKEVTGAQFISAGNGASVPAGTNMHSFCIAAVSGVTFNNDTFYPMLRRASDADPTFEPYSNIRPISGVTSVSVTRTGKNLLNWPDRTVTLNGVTAVSSGGIVKLSGTASSLTQFPCAPPTNMRPGTYILSGCPVGGSATTYDLRVRERIDHGNGVSFEADESNLISGYFITVRAGVNTNGLVFKPMIRPASDADTTFEPYQGQSVTVQLTDGSNPLTVYDGTLNVTTGELTVLRKKVTFNGSERWGIMRNTLGEYTSFSSDIADMVYIDPTGWALGDILCSHYALTNASMQGRHNIDRGIAQIGRSIRIRDVDLADMTVDEYKAWLAQNPIEVLYPLATPAVYHLTPAQLSSLAGYNTFISDNGIVSVTYRFDPTKIEIPE